jgi:spore coat polysaccharide biosynthesis protein SpsF (cytidylyltransferase family)
LYIRRNLDNYRVGIYKGNYKLSFPQARLTVDYIEDYELVNEIYTKLNLSNNANDVLKIDKFLSRNQDLLKINKHIEQKKVQESEW